MPDPCQLLSTVRDWLGQLTKSKNNKRAELGHREPLRPVSLDNTVQDLLDQIDAQQAIIDSVDWTALEELPKVVSQQREVIALNKDLLAHLSAQNEAAKNKNRELESKNLVLTNHTRRLEAELQVQWEDSGDHGCLVCMAQPATMAIPERGHLCLCSDCAAVIHKTQNKCPYCNQHMYQWVVHARLTPATSYASTGCRCVAGIL